MNDVRLPEAEYSVYDVDVVRYAGEPDYGVIVAGHGRRSYAAINSVIRKELGRDEPLCNELGHELQTTMRELQKTITARWVVFVYTCGCTEAQHVEHDDGVDCPCEYYSLPPCSDYNECLITYSSADTPDATPVLEVLW